MAINGSSWRASSRASARTTDAFGPVRLREDGSRPAAEKRPSTLRVMSSRCAARESRQVAEMAGLVSGDYISFLSGAPPAE